MSDVTTPALKIGVPTPEHLRTVWPTENGHFTPWLAEHLEYLELLELGPLELVDTEVSVPDTSRALDILAETGEGDRIAIENQFGIVDHDHLTRGLAYAVGLRATALVVIAEDHRPEFVAVADYLNRAFEALDDENGIAVFLVRLRLERLDTWVIPRLELVSSRPNSFRAASRHAGGEYLTSVDDFLGKSPTEWRPVYEQLINGWEGIPGSYVGHHAKTCVALYLPSAQHSRNRCCVLQLWTGGEITICKKPLAEADAFSDPVRQSELQNAFNRWTPEFGGGASYPRIEHPNVAKLLEFAQWLTPRLTNPGGGDFDA